MRTLVALVVCALLSCSADAQCNTANFQTCLTTFNAAVGLTSTPSDWSDASAFLTAILTKFTTTKTTTDLTATCAVYDALATCAAAAGSMGSCTSYMQLSQYKVLGMDKYRIAGGLNVYNYMCNGAQASNTNAMWQTCLQPVLANVITPTVVTDWVTTINMAYDAFALGTLKPDDIDRLMNITAETGAQRFVNGGGAPAAKCCACYASVPYVWGCQYIIIASGLTLNPDYAPNYACPDRVPVKDGDCLTNLQLCAA